MITIDCLIEGHPIAPHHHAVGEHGSSVAFGCDFWEDNACQCGPVFGAVFFGVAPVDEMNVGQDSHTEEKQ